MRRGLGVRASRFALRSGLACALTCGLACSHEDDKPRTLDLTPAFARGALTIPEAGTSQGAHTRRDDSWPEDVDSSLPRIQMMVTRTVVVDAGRSPVVVNPDDAILERARVAAGGCFRSLSAGPGRPAERNAHIVFTVIPTGTVTNADVSSDDTDDEGVLDCLRQQALSTPFSDNAGGPLRTYAIDVRVIAKGNAGAR